VYVIGWALINPSAPAAADQQRGRSAGGGPHIRAILAPMLPRSCRRVAPGALRARGRGLRIGLWLLLRLRAPCARAVLLAAVTLGAVWWYVSDLFAKDNRGAAPAGCAALRHRLAAAARRGSAPRGLQEPPHGSGAGAARLGSAGAAGRAGAARAPRRRRPPADEPLQQLGEPVDAPHAAPVPRRSTRLLDRLRRHAALLAWYYWRFDAEQFEILRMLVRR
jgi:hypothetical protein